MMPAMSFRRRRRRRPEHPPAEPVDLAPIPIDEVEAPSDLVECHCYSAIISARTCALRHERREQRRGKGKDSPTRVGKPAPSRDDILCGGCYQGEFLRAVLADLEGA